MGRFSAGILIAGVCLAGAASADQDTKQLDANYAAITADFKKKDIDAIGKMIAPDFLLHQEQGTPLTKAAVLKAYKQQAGLIKDFAWVRTITATTKKHNEIVATVAGKITGQVDTPDKKSHKLLLLTVAKDTWEKSGAGWILKATTVVSRNATMDGKPFKIR